MDVRNGPYVLVAAPDDYPGRKYRGRYVYEHHLVWWRNTGEVVPDGSVVHHKNEDKTDNRFENLIKATRGKHAEEHNAARRSPPVVVACGWCGGPAEVRGRDHRRRRKQGQDRFFCSRSCAVRQQQSRRSFQGRPTGKPLAC